MTCDSKIYINNYTETSSFCVRLNVRVVIMRPFVVYRPEISWPQWHVQRWPFSCRRRICPYCHLGPTGHWRSSENVTSKHRARLCQDKPSSYLCICLNIHFHDINGEPVVHLGVLLSKTPNQVWHLILELFFYKISLFPIFKVLTRLAILTSRPISVLMGDGIEET